MKSKEFLIDTQNRLSVCDEAADVVFDYTRTLIKDTKECLRYRLAVEDCLLKWLSEDAIGHKLTLIFKKSFFGSPSIELRYNGPKCNPLQDSDDEYEYSTRLLLGLTPMYLYRKKENVVHFDLRSAGSNSFKKLAVVLLAAFAVGFLGQMLLPTSFLEPVVTNILEPVNDMFLNVLSCIAGPMIFLSVASGIYGIGDTSTLSKVGSSMMKIFIRNDFLAGLLCISLFPLCGLTLGESQAGSSQFSGLFQMILDIVPSNIVDPFSTGNTLQIIFLAFVVGFALLYLGKKASPIVTAVNHINFLVQFLMEAIGSLIPYFVFIVIVTLFWSGDVSVLSSSWKFFVYLLPAMFIVSMLLLVFVSYKCRVPLLTLLKKCIPSFLVALTTASSAATFSTNVEICKNRLGIAPSVIDFGVPLGMVINNPIAVVNNITVAFFFASVAGVETSLIWLISAILVATVCAIASPPIPGGGAIVYTMLFLQLGIPTEYLALAFAIDLISDFAITAFEMLCLAPTILEASTRVDLTDKEILLQP